jgi:VIT1/CCC1 family predicted Fe2+/Mn2+ transporter
MHLFYIVFLDFQNDRITANPYGAFCFLISFFVPQLFPSLRWTYLTALSLALFGLGAFLGHVSRRRVAVYGLRTVIAGGISIVISLLLGHAG